MKQAYSKLILHSKKASTYFVIGNLVNHINYSKLTFIGDRQFKLFWKGI